MFQEPFLELWESLIAYLPQILGAVVVFLVGMLLALVLSKVIRQVVQVLGIDQLAAHFEIKAFFEKIGIHLQASNFLIWI